MKLTFLGHSAILLEGAGGRVLVDPFLTGNPKAAVATDAVVHALAPGEAIEF